MGDRKGRYCNLNQESVEKNEEITEQIVQCDPSNAAYKSNSSSSIDFQFLNKELKVNKPPVIAKNNPKSSNKLKDLLSDKDFIETFFPQDATPYDRLELEIIDDIYQLDEILKNQRMSFSQDNLNTGVEHRSGPNHNIDLPESDKSLEENFEVEIADEESKENIINDAEELPIVTSVDSRYVDTQKESSLCSNCLQLKSCGDINTAVGPDLTELFFGQSSVKPVKNYLFLSDLNGKLYPNVSTTFEEASSEEYMFDSFLENNKTKEQKEKFHHLLDMGFARSFVNYVMDKFSVTDDVNIFDTITLMQKIKTEFKLSCNTIISLFLRFESLYETVCLWCYNIHYLMNLGFNEKMCLKALNKHDGIPRKALDELVSAKSGIKKKDC